MKTTGISWEAGEFQAATLRSSTTLVELSISVPSGNKTDPVKTTELVTAHSADLGVAKVVKNIYSGSAVLVDAKKFVAKVRQRHVGLTLPWSDNGPRLLPAFKLIDYMDEMNSNEQEFNGYRVKFAHDLPNLRTRAAFVAGNLYNPADYPSDEEIMDKWRWSLTYSDHSPGDFRIDLDEASIEELKQQAARSVRERYNGSMQHILGETMAHCQRMVTQLTPSDALDKHGNPVTKRLHETLITSLDSLVQMLSGCNLYQDRKIEEIVQACRKIVGAHSVEEWRNSETLRDKAVEAVEDVLAKFDF